MEHKCIHYDENFTIQKADVFGTFDEVTRTRTSEGMIVAQGSGHCSQKTICPIFGDEVPWKSVTVVCQPEQEGEVIYWLAYVHGGNNISARRVLDDGRIAIRSNYMCW